MIEFFPEFNENSANLSGLLWAGRPVLRDTRISVSLFKQFITPSWFSIASISIPITIRWYTILWKVSHYFFRFRCARMQIDISTGNIKWNKKEELEYMRESTAYTYAYISEIIPFHLPETADKCSSTIYG